MAVQDDVEISTVSDKVNIIFKMFDKNKDGKISKGELTEVLQFLDKKTWTPQAVETLLRSSDTNGDGDLQFTEFWGWVCGHGKKEKEKDSTVQDALLVKAVEEERAIRAVQKAKHDRWEARMKEKKRKQDEEARKEEERRLGKRIGREKFVEDRLAVGLNREVASKLFRVADEDRDGEVDQEDLEWLSAGQASSVGQIKGLFQEGCQPPPDSEEKSPAMQQIIETFTRWDTDGNGTISSEELETVVRTLNPDLGEKTVAMIMKEADVSKDGVVDINEFVNWLCGGNPKKKKDQEDRQSKISVSLHRKRSEEAIKQSLQDQFEEVLHGQLPKWCQKSKIKPTCGTLNVASASTCRECSGKHAWLCHGCGFVSFYQDCVNNCSGGKAGWSCIAGKCMKKCGCKKKPDWWQRKGFVPDLSMLTASVPRMLDAAKAAAEAEARAKAEAEAAAAAEAEAAETT